MYIDLNLEVRTNAEFQHKLKVLTTDISKLEKLAGDDPKVNDKIGERIIDIYRLCKYNAGLLVPYFFPQYPYDKPLSCTARPYSYAMFHMQIGGSTTFRAGRQIGKALRVSELCMTPEGYKPMYSIKVGDYVFDGKGLPTLVTGVFPQGKRPVYRMTFTDNSYVECDEEHLWVCKKGGKSREFSVKSLRQIRARKGGDNPSSDQGIRIPLADPIQFREKPHFINPYILGLLLGDGSLTPGNTGFTTSDKELAEAFQEQAGISLVETKAIYHYRINKDAEGKNTFLKELEKLNLRQRAENKSIPEEYLYDSVRNRIALLRGLMDTDGTIYGKCQIEFYSVSNTLAKQVQYLVHSLGGCAVIKEKEGYYIKDNKRVDCQLCYRVKIKMQDINPFKLKRKSDKFYNIRYERTRVLKNISYVGEDDTVCITVDSPEKTFITRDCIVTHNSTSLSARQLIYSHVIPKHRSMYVVPHQSFLDTYANRQREMERVFRFYQKHKEYRQNLKYKEYPNGSVTMLVKCLSDTQEARSKSAYELLYDESVHPNTIIPVCEGGKVVTKRISDILVGEKVLAYDSSGCIKPAYVRDNRNKGIKNVWKLKFSNGSELICTGNTRFWTNRGWMFLSEFLSWEEAARGDNLVKAKTLLAIREAATPGDSSWRRQHAMGREIMRENSLYARTSSGGILQTQGSHIKKLCEDTATNCGEPWLGGQELCILDCAHTGIQFYVCPGLPPGSYQSEEASQNDNTGMGGAADMGRNSLVVSGRRNSDSSWGSTYQHPWVSAGAGGDVSEHAYTEGSSSESPASEKGGENLFYNSDRIRGNTQIHRESEAVCSRVYTIQSESAGSDIFEMPFLRDSISKEGRTSIGYACVRGLFVPEKSCRLENQEVCTEPWGKLSVVGEKNKAQIDTEPRIKKSLINEEQSFGRETKARSSIYRKMESHSRRLEEEQCGKDKTTKNFKDGGSCLCGATKGESKIAGAGSYKENSEIRATENSKRAETKIESVNLLSIEYAGKEEVWDIDVETYHTFFANGVAVHNCQLLDPDFIPDIEQCQKAYNTPITIYAGTSTTVDSLLETNYQDSSQACWLLRAPGYESKSAGRGWLNCGDQEDVMKAMSIMGIKNPATGKVIDVTDGHFVHQLQSKFDQGYLGFHIPQIIIPDYANRPQKWMEIWNAYERYDIKKFLQEILGIPTEEGMREISMNDLKRMCCLTESPQTLKEIATNPSGRYKYIISGCDWGGSDYNPASKTKISYTVHVIVGVTWDGYVDILHIRQYSGMDYRSIANQICEDHAAYNAVGIASDFGVGAAYNMLLRENPRIKAEKHLIFNYVGPQSSLIKAPANGGWFNQYSLNRTESITTLYDGIKRGRVRCYAWELAEERLLEFLNLYRMPVESPGGNATFKYQRHGSKADDTLHAVNFAYCLARIILEEPIVEDPTLRRVFQNTFNPQVPQFITPNGGWNMGGVISG